MIDLVQIYDIDDKWYRYLMILIMQMQRLPSNISYYTTVGKLYECTVPVVEEKLGYLAQLISCMSNHKFASQVKGL